MLLHTHRCCSPFFLLALQLLLAVRTYGFSPQPCSKRFQQNIERNRNRIGNHNHKKIGNNSNIAAMTREKKIARTFYNELEIPRTLLSRLPKLRWSEYTDPATKQAVESANERPTSSGLNFNETKGISPEVSSIKKKELEELWKMIVSVVEKAQKEIKEEESMVVEEAQNAPEEEIKEEELISIELEMITKKLVEIKKGSGGGAGDNGNGDGGSSGGDGGDDQEKITSIDGIDKVITFIVATAKKRYGDSVRKISLIFRGIKDGHSDQYMVENALSEDVSAKAALLDSIKSLDAFISVKNEENVIEFTIKSPWPPKHEIDALIYNDQGGEVAEHLLSTTGAVLCTSQENGLKIPDIDQKLVTAKFDDGRKIAGFDGSRNPFQITPQPDKAFAVVVAGESGSGKSVFATNEPLVNGYNVLYVAFQSSDFKKLEVSYDPNAPERSWLVFIQAVIDYYEGNEEVDCEPLFELKSLLNRDRNSWAIAVRDKALSRVLGSGQAKEWWQDRAKGFKPDKLAIVLDEATNLDLADGLVDTCQTFASSKHHLSKQLPLIVVSGTGLDAIRTGNHVGTNPSKCFLVTMTGPSNTRSLHSNAMFGDAVKAAPHGLFSRVLMTNTRMYFRGVLPVLGLDFLKLSTCDSHKKLVEAGSAHVMMCYAVEKYLVSHSDAKWELLEEAFTYHLQQSLSDAEPSPISDTLKKLRKRVNTMAPVERMRKNNGSVFEKGLARREGTSCALKYLACFGLTDKLEPSDGYKFEHLTRLHVERFMMIQGFDVWKHELLFAWPPKSGKSDYTETRIDELNTILDGQKKKEKKKFRKLYKRMKKNEKKKSVIFSQGTPTAQGGDVLVLKSIDDESMELISIQCQHYSSWSTAINRGWLSLGVANAGKQKPDFHPTSGKAGYSYAGLSKLCEMLTEVFKKKVSVGKRVLAVSLSSGKLSAITIPSGDAEVWPREWFEPTISVMGLRKEDDDEDDEDDDEKDDDDEDNEEL